MTILKLGKRVVLIGDSHMEALGPRLLRSLPRQLGIRLTRVIANRGKSADWYVKQGIVPALSRGADVVIFELGGNDASQHIGPDKHKLDVATLVQQARPAQVIWIGPGVTTRADLERYRGPIRWAQKAVVRGAGGAWIDSQGLTRVADLRSDGVHFTGSGYDRWSQLLLRRLATAEAAAPLPAWVGPVAFLALAGGGTWLYLRRRR